MPQTDPQISSPPQGSAGDRPVLGYAQPGTAQPAGPLEPYNRVAETVGLVPSLRWRDNLIQAVVVLFGTLVGAIVGGWFLTGMGTGPVTGMGTGPAVVLGAIAGLILSTFLSGLFLMILRLKRK